jgi:hypothetical protein
MTTLYPSAASTRRDAARRFPFMASPKPTPAYGIAKANARFFEHGSQFYAFERIGSTAV